jgi:hypothetical protein
MILKSGQIQNLLHGENPKNKVENEKIDLINRNTCIFERRRKAYTL